MNQKPLSLEDTPVVAAVKEAKVSDSRQRFDQIVQREVQDAVERKQLEVADMLAKAGVPINDFPDTEEGVAQLHAWMKEHEITVDKLVYQDAFRRSGYYVSRAGIEIGMVPCEIVRGVMI